MVQSVEDGSLPAFAPAAPSHARLRAARRRVAELRWYQAYRRALLVTDVVAMTLAVVISGLARQHGVIIDPDPSAGTAPYLALGALVVVGWAAMLSYTRSRDIRVLGSGPAEYQRVFGGTWRFFAAVAVAAFVLRYEPARGYIAIAAPVGLGGLLLSRYLLRQWLHRRRAEGQCVATVLAIGHRSQIAELVADLNLRPDSGYRVVGACVPVAEVEGDDILGVPVLGDLFGAAAVAENVRVDAVAVAGSDALSADVVRRLGWELEPAGVDLMLTTALADVAGPRITITPSDNVALVHVDAPRFTGARYLAKAVTDWLAALAIVVVLSPLMACVAVAVKLSSPGKVLFRQDRVGRDGEVFSMYKFRSMRDGADQERELLAEEDEGSGLLFKIRDDPRVTRVGRILRRYSLDELPQLFNVLRGDMSLVGPRPPLPSEVSAYEARVRRRLLVRPGMTGLWQTSGRSDLSWEQSVRLDVYYAENWTLFGDAMILARTAKAVLGGRGAY